VTDHVAGARVAERRVTAAKLDVDNLGGTWGGAARRFDDNGEANTLLSNGAGLLLLDSVEDSDAESDELKADVRGKVKRAGRLIGTGLLHSRG
jgi:hypothetical protein